MNKLETEMRPINSLEDDNGAQDANIVNITSRLKNKATKKINQTVSRIIQLPNKYSQGLKAPRKKQTKKKESI